MWKGNWEKDNLIILEVKWITFLCLWTKEHNVGLYIYKVYTAFLINKKEVDLPTCLFIGWCHESCHSNAQIWVIVYEDIS